MILLKNFNDINSNFQDSITQNWTYEKNYAFHWNPIYVLSKLLLDTGKPKLSEVLTSQ